MIAEIAGLAVWSVALVVAGYVWGRRDMRHLLLGRKSSSARYW